MSDDHNPAHRLHKILKAAYQQEDSHKQIAVFTVWANALECQETDTIKLLTKIIEMIKLIDTAESHLRSLNADQAHLAPYPKIKAVLRKMNLRANWKTYRDQISELDIQAIYFGAVHLEREAPQKEIEQNELYSLLTKTRRMISQVANSKLAQELKTALLQMLEGIRQAIENYQISGIEGLRKAVEHSFGYWVTRADLIDKLEKEGTKEDNLTWQNTHSIIDAVYKVVRTICAVSPIVLNLSQHLPELVDKIL